MTNQTQPLTGDTPGAKNIKNILGCLVALAGKGLAEKAYENTVTGSSYAESVMEAGQALTDNDELMALIASAPALLTENARLREALEQIADGEAGPLDCRQDSFWRQEIARAALSNHTNEVNQP